MDWFDAVTGTVLVLGCVVGIAFFSWRSWQERAFNQYYAGQITMLAGFLTVFVPPRVYSIEDDFTFWLGGALIFIGLGQAAWFKRKSDTRDLRGRAVIGDEPVAKDKRGMPL